MKFTDRFMEVKSRTFKFEDESMSPHCIETVAKINPNEISSYTTYDDDPTPGTYLLLKSGEEFWIPMPVGEFEQSLNEQYLRWAKG